MTRRSFDCAEPAHHPRAKRKRSEGSCAADKYKNLSFNTNHHPDKSKFKHKKRASCEALLDLIKIKDEAPYRPRE